MRTHSLLRSLLSLLLGVNLCGSVAWADTGTATTTLTIDPSATAGTTITAADENDRSSDTSTYANAHVHRLSNTTNVGDAAAGNKNICADAADTTDACIRWNDTANLWTVDNPTPGTFNQIATYTGVIGITTGGLVFGGGTGALEALAVSTNGQLPIGDGTGAPTLATITEGAGTTITNGAGSITLATFTQVFVGSFTRDTSTATGTQSVTGVGFVPRAIFFFGGENGVASEMSIGFDDGTTRRSVADNNAVTASSYDTASTNSIYDIQSSGVSYAGVISTFDSDGFTISWTRTSTPTGTLTISYLAVR